MSTSDKRDPLNSAATRGITELQCIIHGVLVTVNKRMEERYQGAFMVPYQVRVYDIYLGDVCICPGLGEPFGKLSELWLDGKK